MSLEIVFTETDATDTFTFGALGMVNVRQALDIDPGFPLQDIRRYHVPGVDGQYLVRLGEVGRTITMRVRYMGVTKDASEANYNQDLGKLSLAAYTIATMGQTYEGCNLTSSRRSAVIRPTGIPVSAESPNTVFFDAEFVFTKDRG